MVFSKAVCDLCKPVAARILKNVPVTHLKVEEMKHDECRACLNYIEGAPRFHFYSGPFYAYYTEPPKFHFSVIATASSPMTAAPRSLFAMALERASRLQATRDLHLLSCRPICLPGGTGRLLVSQRLQSPGSNPLLFVFRTLG